LCTWRKMKNDYERPQNEAAEINRREKMLIVKGSLLSARVRSQRSNGLERRGAGT